MKRIVAFMLALVLVVMLASVSFAAQKTCNHKWRRDKLLSSKMTWQWFTVSSCPHASFSHTHKRKGWNDRYECTCTICGATCTKDYFVPSTEEPEIVCTEYDWG